MHDDHMPRTQTDLITQHSSPLRYVLRQKERERQRERKKNSEMKTWYIAPTHPHDLSHRPRTLSWEPRKARFHTAVRHSQELGEETGTSAFRATTQPGPGTFCGGDRDELGTGQVAHATRQSVRAARPRGGPTHTAPKPVAPDPLPTRHTPKVTN